MSPQNYEEYWKITLGYTDIYADAFNKDLALIVDFIDRTKDSEYSPEKYAHLQEEVNSLYPKNDTSVRKDINTFVKLGFINVGLLSYHPETIPFLKETDKDKKRSIFSKIVYSNSSFDRSVTNDSNKREINFLIKTLVAVGKLTQEDIYGLMTIDVSTVQKGYLDEKELGVANARVTISGFDERKYNQQGHLRTVLNNLDNLVFVDDVLYLEENAPNIIVETESGKRDAYLQKLYKNRLAEESKDGLGQPSCMLEKLSYPHLIASHIKPFVESSENEAYDANNGLLLSRNMDILFDQGYLSFTGRGEVILSSRLSDSVQKYLEGYSLDAKYLNDNRLSYLEYHRTNIFK